MKLFSIIFIKLCLVCCGFKVEASIAEAIPEGASVSRGYPILDISISEIKEAYAWITSPYTLSSNQQDYCNEAFRITNILTHNLMDVLRGQETRASSRGLLKFLNTLSILKNPSAEIPADWSTGNRIYVFFEETFKSLNILKVYADIPHQAECPLLFDTVSLLFETLTFIKDEIMETLPSSVQKLYENTYKYAEFPIAVINTFVYKGNKFPGGKLKNKADKMIEAMPKWLRENTDNNHTPLNFSKFIVEFAIPRGYTEDVIEHHREITIGSWLDDGEKKVGIPSRGHHKKSTKKGKNKKHATADSTVTSTNPHVDTVNDEFSAKSERGTLPPHSLDEISTIAPGKELKAAQLEDSIGKDDISKQAKLENESSAFPVAFSPSSARKTPSLMEQIEALPTTGWLNRKDIRFIGTIFNTANELVGSSDVAAFLKRLVAKQGGSAEYKEGGGSHKLAVLVSNMGKKVLFPFAKHDGRELDPNSRDLIIDGFKELFGFSA